MMKITRKEMFQKARVESYWKPEYTTMPLVDLLTTLRNENVKSRLSTIINALSSRLYREQNEPTTI